VADREREILVMQLFALRAAVDATLTVLEVNVVDGSDIEHCTHPPEKRRYETVLGGPEKWTCQVCGYGYDERKQPSDAKEM
jgi:rubrerythrin